MDEISLQTSGDKTYLKIYFFSILGLSLFPLLGILFQYQIYEHRSFAEVVDLQSREDAIYGTAMNPNDLKYKLELYRSRQTDLIVLGSSRSMQFRKEFFAEPMTNLGGVFSTLSEGEAFIDWLKKVRAPKRIVFVVDYWWFHKKYFYDEKRRFVDELSINKDKLLKPWVWLFQGKISPIEFGKGLLGDWRYVANEKMRALGLRALKTSSGFRYDGSYLDGENIYQSASQRKNKFSAELESIRNGVNDRANFGIGEFVEPKRWEHFLRILRKLDEFSDIVVVLPPVAPSAMDAIDSLNGKFSEHLVRKFRETGIEFVDFTDSRVFGVTENLFLDPWHPSETALIKVVSQEIRKSPKSNLSSWVNLKILAIDLEKLNGQAFSDWNVNLIGQDRK